MTERTPWADLHATVIELPRGDLLLMDCPHPATEGEGFDMVLSVFCHKHGRSVYYCDELAALWCDGGPPDWWWHEFAGLTPLSHSNSRA